MLTEEELKMLRQEFQRVWDEKFTSKFKKPQILTEEPPSPPNAAEPSKPEGRR